MLFFCLFAVDFAAAPNVDLFALPQTTPDSSSSKPDTSSNSFLAGLAGLCCCYGYMHLIYTFFLFIAAIPIVCPTE